MFHVFSTSRYIPDLFHVFVARWGCCLTKVPWVPCIEQANGRSASLLGTAPTHWTNAEPCFFLVISPCLSCLVGIVVAYSRCRFYRQNPWRWLVLVWNDEAWRGYFVGILWPDVIGKINFGEFADAISRASTIAPANHVENCDQEIFYGFPLWRLVETVLVGKLSCAPGEYQNKPRQVLRSTSSGVIQYHWQITLWTLDL